MRKAPRTPGFGRGQGIPNADDNLKGGPNASRGHGPHKIQSASPLGLMDARPRSNDNAGGNFQVQMDGSGRPFNLKEGG